MMSVEFLIIALIVVLSSGMGAVLPPQKSWHMLLRHTSNMAKAWFCTDIYRTAYRWLLQRRSRIRSHS